ncbi:MAG TPA: phosphoglycolate phosphatase [Rhodanobacteraceae bacterium]|nr:phosphoglycolate phosphatase [Rhodanobacteraceae bacterium]
MHFLTGVRALLFDLDGTLIDTAPDIAAAVGATLRDLDRPPLGEREVRSYIGRGVDVLLHRVLTGDRDGNAALDVHRRAREVFMGHYDTHNGRTAAVYPGVREGIAHAQRLGLRLCCVTNKYQGFSDALLAQVGLADAFEFVLGGDALPKGKPDPLPLLHAAERLGIEPGACLMIGDSSNDARAARAAGMPVVLVDYGYSEDQPVASIDCDAIVGSIADVIAALDPVSATRRSVIPAKAGT